MKKKPLIELEFNDGVEWHTLAVKNNLEIDEDIYSLLQALNDEVL